MWLLAINSELNEIRYYYSKDLFEPPSEINGWQIFIFKEPPLKREFFVENGKSKENIHFYSTPIYFMDQ